MKRTVTRVTKVTLPPEDSSEWEDLVQEYLTEVIDAGLEDTVRAMSFKELVSDIALWVTLESESGDYPQYVSHEYVIK